MNRLLCIWDMLQPKLNGNEIERILSYQMSVKGTFEYLTVKETFIQMIKWLKFVDVGSNAHFAPCSPICTD